VAGRTDCCRYEATLDELIDDEVMAPVLRSAGLDPQRFRDLIIETARRFDAPAAGSRADSPRAARNHRHAHGCTGSQDALNLLGGLR
jgi:hypothetical protein